MKKGLYGRIVLTTLAVLTCIAPMPRPAHSQTTALYTFVDLGTLGGASAFAEDINEAGQVTGRSNDSSGKEQAFRATPVNGAWRMDPLAFPRGKWANGRGHSINSHGDVVGYLGEGATSAAVVTWDSGGSPKLPKLSVSYAHAYAINDGGDLAGFGEGGAYLWSHRSGKYTVTTLAGGPSYARGLNTTRQVVGDVTLDEQPAGQTYQTRFAFLWLPQAAFGLNQGLNRLPYPAGHTGNYAVAYDINETGQAVGLSGTGEILDYFYGGAPRRVVAWNAVLWDRGAAVDLGRLPGCARTTLHGANQGVSGPLKAVGNSAFPGDTWQYAATLWDGNGLVDLNAVTANLPAPGVLYSANAINDAGQIVGIWKDGANTRAFLLLPL